MSSLLLEDGGKRKEEVISFKQIVYGGPSNYI